MSSTACAEEVPRAMFSALAPMPCASARSQNLRPSKDVWEK